MKVVVFSPHAAHDPAALPPGHDVSAVSWQDAGRPDDIGLPKPEHGRLVAEVLRRTAWGRAALTLTFLDRGAVFHRATARDARVFDAVRHADLIVATDRDACYAAWKWQRRARRHGRRIRAALGYPAARALIEETAR